jgi:hypothetical protein
MEASAIDVTATGGNRLQVLMIDPNHVAAPAR